MNKPRFILILIVLVLALALSTGLAGAQGATFTSGVQVQNLDSSNATINVTFYNQDGSVEATITADTVPGNGSKTYFPLPATVGDGFNGSMVVASDKPVAAISNMHGNSFALNASYIGASVGNTTVQLPLLMKANSGFDTWFNVQNTGTSAATVNVAYSDGTSAGPVSIPVGAASTFSQASETHSQAVFSGVVTSNQPVAVTVVEESSSLLFAYSGFGGGSTNPVMPLINTNNSGFTTGVQIQNTGASTTNVTLSYTPSTSGTACTETQSIPAGQSKTFTLGIFAGSPPAGTTTNCVAGEKFIGSAKVTGNSANEPLVGIVNQHVLPGAGPVPNGEAYGAFDPASATDTVVMPLIMDDNSGFWTGFNVQNVGGSATTVTCNFPANSTGGPGSVGPTTLQAGGALNHLQFGAINPGYVGSATCTASSGGTILGVVNEFRTPSTADELLVYEAINN